MYPLVSTGQVSSLQYILYSICCSRYVYREGWRRIVYSKWVYCWLLSRAITNFSLNFLFFCSCSTYMIKMLKKVPPTFMKNQSRYNTLISCVSNFFCWKYGRSTSHFIVADQIFSVGNITGYATRTESPILLQRGPILQYVKRKMIRHGK